jgi:hypothetical protein
MTEYPDRRVWDLNRHEVTYLHIDYRFAFDCWWNVGGVDNMLSVVVDTPFVLSTGRKKIQCDPEDVPSVAPALVILHKPVLSLTAHRDGVLEIEFADDMKLVVSKDSHYESWHAWGKGELEDLQVECTPHEGPPWSE